MKNLRLKAMHQVPIYDCTVRLFVSYDAVKTYRRTFRAYGFPPESDDFGAFTVSDGGDVFGLYFHVYDLTAKLLGHEINHLTRMLMDYIRAGATCRHCENDELDSHLCGYLHAWVTKKLKAARIRVT